MDDYVRLRTRSSYLVNYFLSQLQSMVYNNSATERLAKHD